MGKLVPTIAAGGSAGLLRSAGLAALALASVRVLEALASITSVGSFDISPERKDEAFTVRSCPWLP